MITESLSRWLRIGLAYFSLVALTGAAFVFGMGVAGGVSVDRDTSYLAGLGAQVEADFMSGLAQDGLTSFSRPDALAMGRTVCAALRAGSSGSEIGEELATAHQLDSTESLSVVFHSHRVLCDAAPLPFADY